MNKRAVVLLILLCLLTLAACGHQTETASGPESQPPAEDPYLFSEPIKDDSSSSKSTAPEASVSPVPSGSEPTPGQSEDTPEPSSPGKTNPPERQPGGTSKAPSAPSSKPAAPPPQPTPSQIPAPAPEPDPTPSEPAVDPEPTPDPQPAGPFDYPFNPEQIVAEMRSYGESLGLTYGKGSSNGQSVTASQNYQGSNLRRGLQSAIAFLVSEEFKAYGGETPTHFRIGYSGSGGRYTFVIYY